jgi:hypothetical protein
MILIDVKKTFNKIALSSLFSLIMLVLLLVSGVATIAYGSGGLSKTIAIEGGKISGLSLGENKDIRTFKGIPYTRPPVGPLRWKLPQSVETWKGVRQTTEYSPVCLQPDLPGNTMSRATTASLTRSHLVRHVLGKTNETYTIEGELLC